MRDFYVINHSVLHDNSMGVRDDFTMRGFPAGQCEDTASMAMKRPKARGAEIVSIGKAYANTLNNYKVNLPSTLEPGDVAVMLINGCGGIDIDLFATGWTELCDLFASDSQPTNFGVFYKVMGDPVDTTAACNGLYQSAIYGITYLTIVIRGADQASPLDVSIVSGTRVNEVTPPTLSITPITDNALVLSLFGTGIRAASVGTVPTQNVVHPAGFDLEFFEARSSYSSSLNVVGPGIASRRWSAGDGAISASWSGLATANESYSSAAAAMLVIRPSV